MLFLVLSIILVPVGFILMAKGIKALGVWTLLASVVLCYVSLCIEAVKEDEAEHSH